MNVLIIGRSLKKNRTKFEKLKTGDVFEYEGDFYIKMETIGDVETDYLNALDLLHGTQECIWWEEDVNVVQGQYEIEGE